MMPAGRVVNTPPAVEPLTLGDAKTHLRVVHDHEDALIETLIKAAREIAEDRTWRAFITQTWDVHYDGFGERLTLPLPPLQEVVHLEYVDASDETQTLDPSEYRVHAGSEPATITAVNAWPTVRTGPQSVTVRVRAGYGNAPEDVPEKYRSAMRLLVGNLYEHREAVVVGRASAVELPWAARVLLDSDHARVMSG